ncbi:MAG: AmmeMemoRadiSam system protein B [Deltaproteobacteria bacterium]|nr:AmmeMemoRadiSam system protein B [Deltaproteobacteria bacterium]
MKQSAYRCMKGAATKPMLLFVFGVVMLMAAPNYFVWEGLKMANASEIVTRQAHGSGRWFPGNRQELKQIIESYMENAQPEAVEGRIVAAIAPHAGYIYSGKVAGYTFRAIKDNARKAGQPETVLVLGFSHSRGFPGVALMDGDFIETPLGKGALDTEAAEILAGASPRIFFNYGPHRGEHSAENEIPFVQAALPEAKMVVALMGDHDPETLDALVEALEALSRKKRLLVVASTDMLHDPSYDLVTKTDEKTLLKLQAMDCEGLEKTWGYDNQILCGIGPVLAVMKFALAQGCKKGSVLYYRNSGDDFPEGRGQWVVGYGSAVLAVE